MHIAIVEPFILHVPVTGDAIADSTHRISHWGAPGVVIRTDEGIAGYGYTGTHAHMPTDRLVADCIEHVYGPLLMGSDPREVRAIWQRLVHHPPVQWVGRGGITHLALAAVDAALWDLKAKAAGEPLWRLLGGGADAAIEAYNTDSGWLDRSTAQLVDESRTLVEEKGYRGVKIKVGHEEPNHDLRRIEAVRAAIGPDAKLMVDANGRWDLPTALRFGKHLAEYAVEWFEEPIWYDDVEGHRRLAATISTPIALGEQLYEIDAFREFITAGAVHYIQSDAVRLPGITAWMIVADLAYAHRLPVVPHVGDMAQVHLQLAMAHPACSLLEYIPWMSACFEEPVAVADGFFKLPQQPGAGTTLTPAALDRFSVR